MKNLPFVLELAARFKWMGVAAAFIFALLLVAALEKKK